MKKLSYNVKRAGLVVRKVPEVILPGFIGGALMSIGAAIFAGGKTCAEFSDRRRAAIAAAHAELLARYGVVPEDPAPVGAVPATA